MNMVPGNIYGSIADSLQNVEMNGTLGFALVMILLVVLLAVLAFAVIAYILTAKGLSAIARRRGIAKPWLAWIPLGDAWILGSISDRYQCVAKNKMTKRRKILLILGIVAVAVGSVYGAVNGLYSAMFLSAMETSDYAGIVAMSSLVSLLQLATNGLTIASGVISYFAYYDLYVAAKPKKAVLYLVLSIVVGVVQPFLVYACRNSDEGMPVEESQPEELPAPQAEAETNE